MHAFNLTPVLYRRVSLPDPRIYNQNRLHEAVDVWGVSKKLDLYLKSKKVAREKAEHSSGGGGGGSSSSSGGWGVWGGAKSSSKTEGGGGGNSYIDERRREEAERIRGHLDRVTRPAQWQGVSKRTL